MITHVITHKIPYKIWKITHKRLFRLPLKEDKKNIFIKYNTYKNQYQRIFGPMCKIPYKIWKLMCNHMCNHV